jgi:hypothetical protein
VRLRAGLIALTRTCHVLWRGRLKCVTGIGKGKYSASSVLLRPLIDSGDYGSV